MSVSFLCLSDDMNMSAGLVPTSGEDGQRKFCHHLTVLKPQVAVAQATCEVPIKATDNKNPWGPSATGPMSFNTLHKHMQP